MAEHRLTSSVSRSDIVLDRSRKAFSMSYQYNVGFLSDTALKLSSSFSIEGAILGSSFPKALRFLPAGAFSVSDYLFVADMFNILFSGAPIRALHPFSIKGLRSVTAAGDVASRVRFEVSSDFSFFNFFYFVLFLYLPRLVSLGSGLTRFSTAAIFPNFSVYSRYFGRLLSAYPHYSLVMKRTGIFIFLDDFRVRFDFSVSSYVLKSAYISYLQSEDWGLDLFVYYFMKTKDPKMIDFFRLQKSYFKFFVVGNHVDLV